jgi:predicted ferric reductase
MAPLLKHRHNRPFQLSSAITNGTLPGRFHTLLLVVYVLSNIAYCLVLPWGRPEEASVIAALRGRSGTLAALNLIPTILFALRNNPLIWILKVSYDDFNLLHRWAARLVVVESVVHTLAWLINTYRASNKHWMAIGDVLATTPSYQWGMVGTVIFIAIVVQACSPLRHSFYETFLTMHRILAIVGIVSVYVHIDTHKLPQLPWMQIVFTLLGLEWGFRVVSILWFNWSPRRCTRVQIEALHGEACRLTFDMVRPWTPRPGCHVHVYLPTLEWWTSHPFSVAWCSPDKPRSSEDKLPVTEKDLEELFALNRRSSTISIICRARTGITRKMYDKACDSPGNTFSTWGAIEGPYGGHESLNSYGTVVLFAAGVGITHQVNFVRELIQGYIDGTAATRKVVLVWTVPSAECLEWIKPWMDQILAMPKRREVFRMMIFVSKPRRPEEIRSVSETITMHPGRCPIQSVLDREIASRVGAVAVTVCGAGPFTDDVRAAVRKRVDTGCIEYIEEAFTY